MENYLLKPQACLYSKLDTIPKSGGKVLYTVDDGLTKVFVDANESDRVEIGNFRVFANDTDRANQPTPSVDRLFIVKSTNCVWRYIAASGWKHCAYMGDIINLVITAESLQPYVLKNGDTNRAPMTIASQVLMKSGKSVQSIVDDMMDGGIKVTMNKRNIPVTATTDGQKIYDIPYPCANYDYYKYPIVLVWNSAYYNKKIYLESGQYAMANDTIVLSTSVAPLVKVNDTFNFLFFWASQSPDDLIDAGMVNGTKCTISDHTPINPMNGELWLHPYAKQLKQYNMSSHTWNIIFDNNNMTVKRIKKTKTITANTNIISLGIDNFNKNVDALIVFKNSTYLDEGTDYTVTSDGTAIACPAGQSWIVSDEPVLFSFIVLKNVPEFTGAGSTDSYSDTCASEVVDLQEKVEKMGKQIEALTARLS